jgi:hypothetical protein
MRNIVDEAGEIIAKATTDHTLVGGTTASRWRPAAVENCSGKIPANLWSLIPSSREVLIEYLPPALQNRRGTRKSGGWQLR